MKNHFTTAEEHLFIGNLTEFLNRGPVGDMFNEVFKRAVKGTELAPLIERDSLTEDEMDKLLNVEYALRNRLLLLYVQHNL